MKSFLRVATSFSACVTLALAAVAGPEPLPSDYKQSKEIVTPAPPPCQWQGFYIGVHGGGMFGDGEASSDEYNVDPGDERDWSYDVSGFVGGLQIGYNLQPLRRLVLGVEADAGYLGVDGDGTQPSSPGGDTFAEANGGFYTTLRGRVGIAFDCLLLYVTGGGIGSNYEARVEDDCLTGDCGPALGSGSSDDFRLGWTAGGGAEYLFRRHWSVKLEYLYFDLEDEEIDFRIRDGTRFDFNSELDGHIVRAGVNFIF